MTAEEMTRVAIESSGAGAIVLPSLFEEQVILWREKTGHTLTDRERQLLERSKRVPMESSYGNAEAYLSMVNRASVHASIPIIASLNGESSGNWLDFAGELQEAGADAIELNVHHPPPREYAGPREAEDAVVDLVSTIDQAITIPLFLKLGRDYTSLSHLAHHLLSGVHGLVLYGRSPNVDICMDSFELKIEWALTDAGAISQSLASIMRIHCYCPAMPLAASGGIGSPSDVIRAILAGADVAMVTSALYREGPDVIRTFSDGLIAFMERHRMQSIADLQDKRPLDFDSEQDRLNYISALSSRLQSRDTSSGNHAIRGDRWGHSTTEDE
jgi:dihydroorotate dehydrogenase (fumarate)